MERTEYRRMATVEDTMWWYRAVHAMVTERLNGAGIAPGARLLDAGCGSGGLLRHLAAARPDLILSGLEMDAETAGIAACKSGAAVTIGSVNNLPYPDKHFDVLVSVDVLCHAAVDQKIAMAESCRCLKSGGMLLANLPAYEWMLSAHDRHVHNVRRYTAGQAAQLARASGFTVLTVSYWNCLLFPLMVLARLTVGRQQASSDVRVFPPILENVFFAVTAAERKLARYGVRPPFGGSVVIEARRP
jgi:SAM-dependent methyltransferase